MPLVFGSAGPVEHDPDMPKDTILAPTTVTSRGRNSALAGGGRAFNCSDRLEVVIAP